MTKGSFQGLYTFSEVGEIYGIDSSSLRKQVACEKLVEGKDIKKFGKTWVITEQSMVEKFGTMKFDDYINKKSKEEAASNTSNVKKTKTKRSGRSKKADSMNEKEEKVKDSWISGDIKGVEVKSFGFNTNTSE
ncbi:MAG: helix-turn-helix domain-containing protein [Paraclostridium sp.]